MASQGKLGKRTLIVTGQKPIATVGTNSGGQSTLYEVYATTIEGEPVEEPLRAFTELEEGVPIEYSVERYNHPKYGTSFTLTPPPRNTAKRVTQLEEDMELLLRWAETKGFDRTEVGKWVKDEKEREEKRQRAAHEKAERASEVAAMEPTEAPERPDLDERFGKDAPWSDEDLAEKPSESDGNSEPPKDLELG